MNRHLAISIDDRTNPRPVVDEEKTMRTLFKALVGTATAGAMAVGSASPAFADDHRYRDRDRGISAGDVIAGAVILGGIAAVAGALGGNDRYDRYDRYDRRYRDRNSYRGDRWNSRGNPRSAVERCVRAAESDARRYGYRYADVTEIQDVDDTRYGWRVKGRLVVDGAQSYRGSNRYGRYDRYDRYDRRGYNRADEGRFTCRIERGRVTDLDYSGIRGLR